MKIVLKICLFGLILSTIIWVAKTSLHDHSDARSFLKVVESIKDSSTIFLGSSRVGSGINTDLLNALSPHGIHYNLSISGGTFLSNNVVADLILERNQGNVIIIELSPITPSLPPLISDILREHPCDFLPDIFSYYDNAFLLNFYNSELFTHVSLLEAIRKTRDNLTGKSNPDFGYIQKHNNGYHNTDLFLTFADLKKDATGVSNDPYIFLIDRLEKKARMNKTKILYILPMTFYDKKELDIILPVYHAIPDSSKILYDKLIFDKITKSEYLLDRNHFNATGAEVFTREVMRLIREKILMSSP